MRMRRRRWSPSGSMSRPISCTYRGATQAVVTVRLDESADQLHVTVFDDGRGGASITTDENATGLRGLEERVRAAHGTFTVSSPSTGPTIITAVLPCAS